ncbi:hypothetical protein DRQ33_02570 [bacterium]|nr:MAG: hypothetical protein DRQ33_02570 [bacterium]
MKPNLKITAFVSLILLSFNIIFAVGEQLDEFALFGRGAGSSGDYGISALWGNPAGLSKTAKYSASAAWQNMWGVSQYSQYIVGGYYSTKYLNMGLSIDYFGDPDIYSEMQASATIAGVLPRIYGIDPAWGTRIKYVDVGCPEPYGNVSTVLIDGGVTLFFSHRASLGFYANNILNTQLVGYDINRLYSLGFRYDVSSWASVFADVQISEDGRGEVYLAQRLTIIRWLDLTAGLGGRPTRFFVGLNFIWNDLAIGWGGTIHPELGMCNGGKILWEKK